MLIKVKYGGLRWLRERLGLSTDATVLVQHVSGDGESQKFTDVAEFSDIPSPVKISSNGYAYDGPPYDAGSADALGKLEIKENGLYRLQVADLFGGTRNYLRNVYRLVIRRAYRDFALRCMAAAHGTTKWGSKCVLKPIALRGGATLAFEVVALRRDGFDGDIELSMTGLPEGVQAKGLKIAAGKSRGILLVTANQDAPRGARECAVYRPRRDWWNTG